MTQFGIRTGVPADLPALQEVYRAASLSNAGNVAALLAHPEALILAPDGVDEGRTRVATEGHDHIVGFASTLRQGRLLELEDLFVHPDWMRHGVGRLLVQDIVASAAHAQQSRLGVVANPHAMGFYVDAGFVRDGDVETPFGPGVRMHLDLAASPRVP